MRSECQFFMASQDEREFVVHATSVHQLHVTGDTHIVSLRCSFGDIQFERSQQFDSILTAGRVALATTGLDRESLVPSDTAPHLERVYRQLRRWLQTRYNNDLVCYSEFFPVGQRKVDRVRSFWLGPHAQQWLETSAGAVLRQFRTGRVIFDFAHKHQTATPNSTATL